MMTTCPKCSTGRIPQFAHIENGVCFLCNGAGEVTEQAASRWYAAQLRQDLPRGEAAPSAVGPKVARKTIKLNEEYLVLVSKGDRGQFHLYVTPAGHDIGELPMTIILHRGKVRAIPATICHGLTRHADRVVELMQARLAA